MESGYSAPIAIVFLDFELLPDQRLLRRAGGQVAIGARAFDLLAVLAAHPGKVFSNRVLIEAVWPNTVVIDANLRVQIAALRRLLGEAGGAIVNVAGRGYVFTAPSSTRPLTTGARATSGPPDTPRREPLPAARQPDMDAAIA